MPSMIDMLGAQAVKGNSTSAFDGVPDALKTGIGIAQAAQTIESDKEKVAAQKFDLFQKKLNGTTNLAKAFMYANDTQAPSIRKALQNYGEQTQTPIDMEALDAIRKDPATRLAAQKKLADLASGKMDQNPQETLGIFSSYPALFAVVNDSISTNAKAQNEIASNERIASLRAQASTAAVGQRSENQKERTDLQANKQYSSDMRTVEQGLHQASRAINILKKVNSKELKANKALRNDLTTTLASLVSGGRPATVYGSSHSEFDSAYQNVSDNYNFLMGKADNTLPEDQLKQLNLDMIALQHEYALQQENAYTSLREGFSDRQRGMLDKRFNKFRKQAGLNEIAFDDMSGDTTGGEAPAQAPAAPTTPGQVATPRGEPTKREIFIKEVSNGKFKNKKTGKPFTPDEAAARFDEMYPGAK